MKKALVVFLLICEAALLIMLVTAANARGVDWQIDDMRNFTAAGTVWGKEATEKINAEIKAICNKFEADNCFILFNEKRNDKNCVILQLTVISNDQKQKHIYELWIIPDGEKIASVLKPAADVQPYDY